MSHGSHVGDSPSSQQSPLQMVPQFLIVVIYQIPVVLVVELYINWNLIYEFPLMHTNPLVWSVLQGLSQLQIGRCEFNVGQGARSTPRRRPGGRRGHDERASASQLHAWEQVGDPQVGAWRRQSFHHRALRLKRIVRAQIVDT
jgi:hypothetical protein